MQVGHHLFYHLIFVLFAIVSNIMSTHVCIFSTGIFVQVRGQVLGDPWKSW